MDFRPLAFNPFHVAIFKGPHMTVVISTQVVLLFMVSTPLFQCCVTGQNFALTGPHL